MPYYYLISEVPDEPDEAIYETQTYKKPESCNLLLPSIHSSREDNFLLSDSSAEEAVKALQASCKDSTFWPSSVYYRAESTACSSFLAEQESTEFVTTLGKGNEPQPSQNYSRPEHLPKPPVFSKYKPSFWAYDTVKPDVLEAARALFYERKRQQAMYEAFPTWNNPSGAPRIPSDYELFTAWASLPRSDKMAYVSEVSGAHSPNLIPRDTLETQRAVTMLFASCPDSVYWPSFQFSRCQALPPPVLIPRHHNHPFLLHSPLPFKLD